MKISVALQLVVAWSSLTTPAWAKTNPLVGDFAKLANEQLEFWQVPGLAISVVDGDNTWAEGYGIATLPSTPVTASTLFYCGSTTKAFTSGLYSLLIDSGKYKISGAPLSWETRFSDVIPDDFVLQDAWSQKNLNISDALSHQTGFPRHDKSLARHYGADHHVATQRDYTRSLRYLPQIATPRTTWRYTNIMYAVVSHVIQTVTGTPIGDLFKEKIWNPLGMTSTFFTVKDAKASPNHLAAGYYWNLTTSQYDYVPFLSLKSFSGEGDIISNVIDYSKWMRAFLNEAPPMSKAGYAAVETPRIVTDDDQRGFDAPISYGFGWRIGSYRGHRVLTHDGGMLAYGAELYLLPDIGFGAFAIGNTAGTSNAAGEILIWQLIDDRLGVPQNERFNWTTGWEEQVEEAEEAFDIAVEVLFPDAPNPPVNSSLPQSAYLGTYYHPAYMSLTLQVLDPKDTVVNVTSNKPQFRAVHEDFLWEFYLDFGHVSGEDWVIYLSGITNPGPAFNEIGAAEFQISNGKVTALVAEFTDGGDEGQIIFQKIA